MKDNSVITLFEQQAVSFQYLGWSSNDPFLEALDGLNKRAGAEIIHLERKALRATQFVGVLQAGARMIQILPKIDCDPEGDRDAPPGTRRRELAEESAARNFMYLLAHAGHLKLHNQTLATLKTSQGSWLELLTRLFAVELLTQLQQGFHQDYIRREDYLPYVRGRWNIARQFIRQANLVQGLDVSFDDYSADTLLNRIFHHTVVLLQQATRDPQNRQLLANLELWLLPAEVGTQFRLDELDQIHFTRLNERFQPAFQLARFFLESRTVQLLAGGQRAYAFVFDMDKLFEQFVSSLLQAQVRRILPETWGGCQIELQGNQSRRYLVQPPNPDEEALFHLKPDILLRVNGAPRLIIDTKNKALPLRQPYRSIAVGDAYQMLAYATRFECPRVLLLYPRMRGATQMIPYDLSVQGTPVKLFVASLDLHQPLERLDRLIHEFHDIINSIHTRVENLSEDQ